MSSNRRVWAASDVHVTSQHQCSFRSTADRRKELSQMLWLFYTPVVVAAAVAAGFACPRPIGRDSSLLPSPSRSLAHPLSRCHRRRCLCQLASRRGKRENLQQPFAAEEMGGRRAGTLTGRLGEGMRLIPERAAVCCGTRGCIHRCGAC